MISRSAISLILIQLLCLAFAQENSKTILPDDSIIDGSIIEDYTNTWSVTYVTGDGDEIPNKVWTDYGQIIELNGEKYFHRVQDLYSPKMELQETWINMVKYPSLKPVSFSKTTPSGNFTFTRYEDNSVRSATNFQSETLEVSHLSNDLETEVYDWNLYGMLLVGLPFEEGLEAQIPFYSVQKETVEWLIVNVEGTENLIGPLGNEIQTWKFTTNQNLTFWLTKSAPYVHRLELELQNNAKLIWKTL